MLFIILPKDLLLDQCRELVEYLLKKKKNYSKDSFYFDKRICVSYSNSNDFN